MRRSQRLFPRGRRNRLSSLALLVLIELMAQIVSPCIAEAKVLTASKMCNRFILAAGFGIAGSFKVNVSAHIVNGKIWSRGIYLNVYSPASTLGTLVVKSYAEIFDKHGVVHSFELRRPWFNTLRMEGDKSADLFGPPPEISIPIDVGDTKTLNIKIMVSPVILTDLGVVGLGPEETTIELKQER